jgi:lysyl-tRNA synthetase class 1
MYDFVRIKGGTGKMSKSVGDTITLQTALDMYEPLMVRWMFATNRVGSEFAISFDADVIKIYEDFDRCERIYFKVEAAKTEKDEVQQARVYELSIVDQTTTPPRDPAAFKTQVGFRQITNILQVFGFDEAKTMAAVTKEFKNFDTKRVEKRIACAKVWLEKYAPDEFKFSINSVAPKVDVAVTKPAIEFLIVQLKESNDADVIGTNAYNFCKEKGIDPKAFFESCYHILINKKQGPKLVPFMFNIGKDKVIGLLTAALQ